MNEWMNLNKFVTQDKTVFTKGPFPIDGINYDYKFIDPKNDEVDYAITEQLTYWINSNNPVVGVID